MPVRSSDTLGVGSRSAPLGTIVASRADLGSLVRAQRPVEPNPPAALAVSGSSATSMKLAVTTGWTTS